MIPEQAYAPGCARAIALRASGELVGSVGYTPCFHPFGQVGIGDAPAMGHTAELGL